ncbi:MAG: hypothetical protein ABWZ40_08070 [Caulobacterales bacterium]
MFASTKARLGFAALACVLLAACGRPNVEDAEKAISRFDAMSPAAVLCNPNELGGFRSAVRRYAKAKQSHGAMWPDFTYKNMRPDDLTVTVLAGVYAQLISPRDLGKAAWHLAELSPDGVSWGAYSADVSYIGRPNPELLRNGAQFACGDLVEYSQALAEHQLGASYWQERIVKETMISNRPYAQKKALLDRATKRTQGDLRRVLRLERDLADAIDAKQLAQR